MKSEWIPSKDVRKYVEQLQYRFTDREEAIFLYRYAKMSWSEKRRHLRKLAEQTEDMTLKNEIMEHLQGEQRELRAFRKTAPGILFSCYEDEEFHETYFNNVSGTYQQAKTRGIMEEEAFHICREKLMDQPEKITKNERALYFDKDGEILNTDFVWREKKGTFWDHLEERFEGGHLKMPHPFVRGDAVYDLHNKRYGIIVSEKKEKDERILVMFLKKGKWMKPEMTEPWLLEYETLPNSDVRKEIFQAVKEISDQKPEGLWNLQEAMRRWNVKIKYKGENEER